MYYVYSLINPITEEIKYIGYTQRQNFYSLISKERLQNSIQWIRDLLQQGIFPKIELIKIVQDEKQTLFLIEHIKEHCRKNGNLVEDNLFYIKQAHNKGQSKIDLKQFEKLYLEENKTLDEIKQHFNCSYGTIRNIMKKHNIPNRGGHKYHKDHNYFETIDTPEKAYILGFIATDGNIYEPSKTLNIELQQRDLNILTKIKKHLGYTGTIRTTIKDDKQYCFLSVKSNQIYNDLLKHGITPRKTYTIQFPETIPQQYLSDYLRGVYDGDGSIVIRKDKVYLIMCSANQQYLENIKNHFESIGIKSKVNVYKDTTSKGSVYRLDYGGYPHAKNNSVMMILDYLYKDATIYLDRKYERYQKVKELSQADRKSFKQIKQEQQGFKIIRIEDQKTYPSISEAARDVGSRVVNIKVALENPKRTCKGFHWKKL